MNAWLVVYKYKEDILDNWISVYFNTEDNAWDFIQSLDSNFDFELPVMQLTR